MFRDTNDYFKGRRQGREFRRMPEPQPSLYEGDIEGLLCNTTRPPRVFTPLRRMLEANPQLQQQSGDLNSLFAPEKNRLQRLTQRKRGKYEADPLPARQRFMRAIRAIGAALVVNDPFQYAQPSPRYAKTVERRPFFERTKKKIAIATLGALTLSAAAVGVLQKPAGDQETATFPPRAPAVPTVEQAGPPIETEQMIPLAQSAVALKQHVMTLVIEPGGSIWRATESALGDDASVYEVNRVVHEVIEQNNLVNPNHVEAGEMFRVSIS